ncbi:hypothetical protein Tco_0093554 [Tanacetum coccineum]
MQNNWRNICPLAPKTVKQLAARRNQERVKSILLLAIPDEYLLKVYEDELKRSSGSNSASQNLAFLSLRILAVPMNVSTAMDGDDLEELDLRCQRLSATTVIEKGILLDNVDLEEIKGEDLMVTMAGAMHQQLNLHHRHCDEESTLANDGYSKVDGYKVVPPPIIGNFLTLRADISFAGLDEYAIRNKIIESQTIELNTKTSETACKTNDANTEKPKSVSESVVSNPKINKDSVIIEDWNSDDEEEGAVVNSLGKGKLNTDLKKSRWVWRPKGNLLDHVSKDSGSFMLKKVDGQSRDLAYRIMRSGGLVVALAIMTSNKAYISDYDIFQWRLLAFG